MCGLICAFPFEAINGRSHARSQLALSVDPVRKMGGDQVEKIIFVPSIVAKKKEIENSF